MKRLLVPMAVVLLAALSATLSAAISRGSQVKLTRYLGDVFDQTASEKDRNSARHDVMTYFEDKRSAKDLADVPGLGEILATAFVAGAREDHKAGVADAEFKLSDLGFDTKATVKYVVSVPKKYPGSSDAGWPLIFCLPDRGQTAQDYITKVWGSDDLKDVAESAVIVAVTFDYSGIEEVKQQQEESNGQVKLVPHVEKLPFTWDHETVQVQFWGLLLRLQTRLFKIDPNRIILDGTGLGAEGAMEFGTAAAWRFAGLILRGGAYDGPALQNVRYLKVRSILPESAKDEEKKTAAEIEKVCGKESFSSGAAGMPAFFESCVRQRYPVPSTWVSTAPSTRVGYWGDIGRVFDSKKPATITVNADGKKKIEVTTENVAEFTLYMNDLLANLDDPVEVWVNGQQLADSYTVERSAKMLIEHALAEQGGASPCDPGAVLTAEIKALRVPAPSAVPGAAKDGGSPDKPKDGGKDAGTGGGGDGAPRDGGK